MKYFIKFGLCALIISSLSFSGYSQNKGFDAVKYVSTLVGTESSFELSTGNTYPAVAVPWGMNFWTPQTGKMGDGWVYTYSAHKIRGFKQTHQPSPWINDYGQFSLMPVTDGKGFGEEERQSWFSHKAEIAKPYYYQVYLADHDVVAEMTPTSRAACFRFTYPMRDTSYLVLDAFDKGSYVKIIPSENKIIGYTTRNSGGVPDNFRNWFVLVSDTPFKVMETSLDGKVSSLHEAMGNHAMAIVGFPTKKGQVVNIKVASSFISEKQAELNLKEVGNKSFNQVEEEGKSLWNNILGRIEVQGGNVDDLRTFYSCLYRSVLFPRSFYEFDKEGNPIHYSPFNGKIEPGYMFTDTGFWDTFRSLLPLVNLVYPDIAAKIQAGLVNDYKESGFLPEWASPGHRNCMVGNNSASVVADAYIKGVRGYDVQTLWKAVTHDAHSVNPKVSSTGRLGWSQYDSLGYVPCDIGINESAARTLEYAYDDWCIYQLGKDLGKPESELASYKKGAENYKNLFDSEYKLMVGRKKNGKFSRPFNPLKWGGDFTEGNSLHYTWSVFHSPLGLKKLMGGDRAFISKLDTIFIIPPIFDDSYYGFPIHEIREMQIMNMGNYAHGNQPIQHMLYLYAWSSQPWKAQRHIREVMNKFYNAHPDGYCGDEDNGQTSSWYVFSALGFYPVCPASTQYILGSPLFKKVILHLNNGKTFRILAPNNSDKTYYIREAFLNGKKWDKNYINHGDIVRGGELKFKMSDKPNKTRGIKAEDMPYSFDR